MFFVLAMAVAAFAAPVMAEGAMAGTGGVDILGQGIFETEGTAFKLPHADTNFDSIEVGNDNALAVGAGAVGIFPFSGNNGNVAATNNLEIKKNQDSGACECCQAIDSSGPCQDCCTKYNVEQIKVGNRGATAVGAFTGGFGPFAGNGGSVTATNNVKIVTNQQ